MIGTGATVPAAAGMQIQQALQQALHAALPAKQQQQQQQRTPEKLKRRKEEDWHRIVRSKVDEERQRMEDEEDHAGCANRTLYKLFNDLQGISKDFNISFETPEIVVVGMQSDGKSSFIEALLGFQFNIVDSNIGTRRPLILQMNNNPLRERPYCRFRKEVIHSVEEDPFEDETPVSELSQEIVRRTNEKAGSGDCVCDSPIILCVEYTNCSNLNIYDTPGFRLGGDEKLKLEIKDMVRRLIEPRHRFIVCLEQSTVESVNTVSRPIVQEVDPNFSRTILVNTKFDNRVKEFSTAEQANKYLTGEFLTLRKRPFFISLPVKRNLEPRKFREQIQECYLEDYRRLLEVGFDEKRFGSQLGLFKAKQHLEHVLSERYQQSLMPTMKTLEQTCRRTAQEIATVKRELAECNVEDLKAQVVFFVQAFMARVERLLEGSIVGNPDKFGQTLEQEKLECGAPDWPDGHLFEFPVQNQEYKVYGGAQYERLLNEFEYVAHSREFPATSINEVASALGTSKSHTVPVFEAAASDIVQMKARGTLKPLIDVVLSRCAYIMRNIFDIAMGTLQDDADVDPATYRVAHFEGFVVQLRTVYNGFVEATEAACRLKLKDDFDTFTKILDWDLFFAAGEEVEYDLLQPKPQDTKERVCKIMDAKRVCFDGLRTRRIDQDTYQQVCRMSARLFAGVRYFFAKYIRNKLNAFFLDPMFRGLGATIVDHFRRTPDPQYEQMFNLGVADLRVRSGKLDLQLAKCKENLQRFKEVYEQTKSQCADLYGGQSPPAQAQQPPL
eukprot:TRINITY_DN1282_c0_g1_i1.p1 TRINITY_DN1282_c0_g1~~TRINITY_DN1282_c0_g1_i1.p1  ORF type:complete len:782 (-),score=270.13 TRINITY_DN1282_c0_g1_i1:25-2370(-)